MKLILITLLLIPTITYSSYEMLELTFMLEDLGVLNESEVFNLIFDELFYD
jgi:hypothetical protein